MKTLEDAPKQTPAVAAPSKRGDIISSGVFDGSNGQSVAWVDYVSDQLLYAISGGAKGWATARTEPRRFSDSQKQRQIRMLTHYIFGKITCGLEVPGQS